MNFHIALRLLAVLVVIGSGAVPVEATVYDLYYLGGQSNMDGYGRVEELPEGLSGAVDNVMIFHGNTSGDTTAEAGRGVWAQLRPGHGVGYGSDGKTATYSDRFGIEITFARTLQELDPDARIAIIKYSRGGSSIDRMAAGYSGSWDPDFPGDNQYDHFLATIRNATSVADIDGDGEADTLIPKGILWMQGESDAAYSQAIAERYGAHLSGLVNLMRAALRADDLPVVIGRISDSGRDDDEKDGKVWNHGGIVRKAQAAFVADDGNAALVTSTDDYDYSDPWHYDSAGYIDLGRKFADAVHDLQAGSSTSVADPDPLRFQTQIDAFARWDGEKKRPEMPLLFVGSSSIVYWPVEKSFPGCNAVNRGFGGAHISDVQFYFGDLISDFLPKAVVFYAGDNDVAAGKSPSRIFGDFKEFVEAVRTAFGETPILFLAIKPSGSRWHQWQTMEETNSLVRDWAESQTDVTYVDVATSMLGGDGVPREELFVGDRLHMNGEGYVLWDSIVAPYLAPFCSTED